MHTVCTAHLDRDTLSIAILNRLHGTPRRDTLSTSEVKEVKVPSYVARYLVLGTAQGAVYLIDVCKVRCDHDRLIAVYITQVIRIATAIRFAMGECCVLKY